MKHWMTLVCAAAAATVAAARGATTAEEATEVAARIFWS